jgi:hypothetical protein
MCQQRCTRRSLCLDADPLRPKVAIAFFFIRSMLNYELHSLY